MSREAMQMALEALESVTGHFTRTPSTLRDSEVRGEAHKAITVLRQALETEREWVGLTDEEKIELWNKHENHWRFEDNLMAFTRAIEAKLKEKNT